MNFLNYHHLRYFWTVGRKGSIRAAAEDLGISQPSISSQIQLLEESLGEKLFVRKGRGLALTEAGQLAMTYAEEIFAAGRDLANAISQGSTNRAIRLNVGMTDSLSKLIAFECLRPAYEHPSPTHVVTRQGELRVMLEKLQSHRLDLVLADEPATSSQNAKTYNHLLGRSGVTFCAAPRLASKLRRNFPKSLDGAPAFLPSENMGMRWALESWFDKMGLRPRIVGEFEDYSLMQVASSGGYAFTAVHTIVEQTALKHFGLKTIANAQDCASDFYAITAERRVKNPLAVKITEHAFSNLFTSGAH